MNTRNAFHERRGAAAVRGRSGRDSIGEGARERLLAGLPVTEQRLELSGISTAVIEGGAGAPMLLLHGPGGSAVHWWRVIPELVTTNRVVAPDLPGQGASEVVGEPLDAGDVVERVLDWLAGLIEHTCESPPTLVGYALGGAIAARFARRHGDSLDRLVLVDSLGLTPFDPPPEFGLALEEFLVKPSEVTHEELWRHCAMNLDGMRRRIGQRWGAFESYNIDRASTPSVVAALSLLMEKFGMPAIEPAELARIPTPTTLIWGRHDLATPLRVAEAVSARHGWELRVIEECADDPPVEQPDAFVRVLRGEAG